MSRPSNSTSLEPAAPDPLENMKAHALGLAGDDAKRVNQVEQFFKEMGPVVRKLWDASFDDEAWAEIETHHEAVKKQNDGN